MHDNVLNQVDGQRERITTMLNGETMRALKLLERISALQPAVSSVLEATLSEIDARLFECSSPSPASVKERLRVSPIHDCGLTFGDAQKLIQEACEAAGEAQRIFDATISGKLEVFLAPTVRERLKQGQSEPVIGKILASSTIEELRDILADAVLKDERVVRRHQIRTLNVLR